MIGSGFDACNNLLGTFDFLVFGQGMAQGVQSANRQVPNQPIRTVVLVKEGFVGIELHPGGLAVVEHAGHPFFAIKQLGS